MTFMVFLKAVLTLGWIALGLFLFREELFNTVDDHVVPSQENDDLSSTSANKKLQPEPLTTPIVPVQVAPEVVPAPVIVEKDVVVEKEDEPEEDDGDMENVQFFKTEIKARADFYETLNPSDQKEFRSYFVDNHPSHLAKELNYVIGQANPQFFMTVFNHILKYRKLISSSLLTALTDELMTFTGDDASIKTLIYEAAVRVAYYRRKQPEMLKIAELWAGHDVKLHSDILNSRDRYVYSYTRLAIILEKKGDFKSALALVNDALNRQLSDRTRTGYIGRKERLLKKLNATRGAQ